MSLHIDDTKTAIMFYDLEDLYSLRKILKERIEYLEESGKVVPI